MFQWSRTLLFLRVQFIGLDCDLVPNRCQAVIWTNTDPIHARIYAALGGDELRCSTVKPVCNDHLYNKIYYLWFIQ